MKKEFQNWYKDLKNEHLETLKELRKKSLIEKKKANIISAITSIIIDILLIVPFAHSIINNIGYVLVFILLLIILNKIIENIVKLSFQSYAIDYKNFFKEVVIDDLIKNFYDEVKYEPSQRMSYDIYDEAKYPLDYDEYESENYFEGLIDNKYKIKMAEVKTLKQQNDAYTIQFHGVFARIELDKSIDDKLIIKPNEIFDDRNKIEMDSQEFERYFDVISKNRVVAMQILTHEIMEVLIALQRITNNGSWISIYNNKLYLRIPTGPIFECKHIKNEVINKEELDRYYRILDKIYSLAKIIIRSIEDMKI